MVISDKISTKEIVVGVALLAVFVAAMLLVLNVYQQEGEKRSAVISEEGEKDPDHVEIFAKLLSVDPVKGDAVTRLEFEPHGSFAREDGSLARSVKLFVNSANGKQETEFAKGKRMNAVEVVVNMFDSQVTDYPFDKHSAFLEMYFYTPATAPAAGDGGGQQPAAPQTAADDDKPAAPKKDAEPAAEEEVPIAVDFYGSIPGLKVSAAKAPESEDDYVGIDMKIERSGTVVFFSIFVAILMWALALAVLLLTLSVILRGRKVELAMFSFLAALLFAFYAVRNSQPGVPLIGTYSDFIAFFWAEVIIALCLVAIIFVWLLRPTAK